MRTRSILFERMITILGYSATENLILYVGANWAERLILPWRSFPKERHSLAFWITEILIKSYLAKEAEKAKLVKPRYLPGFSKLVSHQFPQATHGSSINYLQSPHFYFCFCFGSLHSWSQNVVDLWFRRVPSNLLLYTAAGNVTGIYLAVKCANFHFCASWPLEWSSRYYHRIRYLKIMKYF